MRLTSIAIATLALSSAASLSQAQESSTTIYERGAETAWTSDEATTWTLVGTGAERTAVTEGSDSYLNVHSNGTDFECSKSITPGDMTTLTFEVMWSVSNNGNGTSAIKFGQGNEFQVNGQAGTISVIVSGAASVKNQTIDKALAANGTWRVTFTHDALSGKVNYAVSSSANGTEFAEVASGQGQATNSIANDAGKVTVATLYSREKPLASVVTHNIRSIKVTERLSYSTDGAWSKTILERGYATSWAEADMDAWESTLFSKTGSEVSAAVAPQTVQNKVDNGGLSKEFLRSTYYGGTSTNVAVSSKALIVDAKMRWKTAPTAEGYNYVSFNHVRVECHSDGIVLNSTSAQQKTTISESAVEEITLDIALTYNLATSTLAYAISSADKSIDASGTLPLGRTSWTLSMGYELTSTVNGSRLSKQTLEAVEIAERNTNTYVVKRVCQREGNEVEIDSETRTGVIYGAIALTEADMATIVSDELGLICSNPTISPASPRVEPDGKSTVTVTYECTDAGTYSIRYVAGTETIATLENVSGKIGSAIALTAEQKADVTKDGKTYTYASDDAATLTMKADGSTVVTVLCTLKTQTAAQEVGAAAKSGDRYSLSGAKVSGAMTGHAYIENGQLKMTK